MKGIKNLLARDSKSYQSKNSRSRTRPILSIGNAEEIDDLDINITVGTNLLSPGNTSSVQKKNTISLKNKADNRAEPLFFFKYMEITNS